MFNTYLWVRMLRKSVHIKWVGSALGQTVVTPDCLDSHDVTLSGPTVLIPTGGQSKQTAQRKSHLPEESVLIKANGRTYAELLQTVKKGIDIEKIDVKIRTIRKSRDGDLVLTVQGEGKASTLKEEIRANIKEVLVSTRKQETTLFVCGLDAVTSQSEIRTAISNEVRVGENQINILSIRPGRNGNQNATVAMSREPARLLIRRGSIRIGWVNCQVRERIPLQRCFKCFEFGHRAQECKEEKNRTGDYLNCGQHGHQAKECTNKPYCIKCEKFDHRFDQVKCPLYRKLLQEARARRMH